MRSSAETARQAVSAQRARSFDLFWTQHWVPYTESLGLDPFLSTVADKVPYLRVLAHRIRSGAASRSGQPVRAPRVRDEILAVAKGFTDLGHPDPRLTSTGLMDPRLTHLYSAYSNDDPAPHRVKPLPIQIIHHATALILAAPTPKLTAAIDMIWIAFFFLLRPGEYCHANDNHPLCLGHVTFTIGHHKLNTTTAAEADLRRATNASLTFDNQKNRERGEVIGHAHSGHSIACPVHALAQRCISIRQAGGTASTPLCTYSRGARRSTLSSNDLTAVLRSSANALSGLGFAAPDINARSLRVGGAMALLCGKVDADTIRLVGRWKSDAMFRYLHAQALPLIRDLASTMLTHGNFTLLPGTDVPPHVAPTLAAL